MSYSLTDQSRAISYHVAVVTNVFPGSERSEESKRLWESLPKETCW